MTPAEEDAFVARYLDHDTEGRPNGFAKIMTDEEFRLAIRAAYAQGVAQERERCAYICDRWSGVGDVVARAIAAAIRRGDD